MTGCKLTYPSHQHSNMDDIKVVFRVRQSFGGVLVREVTVVRNMGLMLVLHRGKVRTLQWSAHLPRLKPIATHDDLDMGKFGRNLDSPVRLSRKFRERQPARQPWEQDPPDTVT